MKVQNLHPAIQCGSIMAVIQLPWSMFTSLSRSQCYWVTCHGWCQLTIRVLKGSVNRHGSPYTGWRWVVPGCWWQQAGEVGALSCADSLPVLSSGLTVTLHLRWSPMLSVWSVKSNQILESFEFTVETIQTAISVSVLSFLYLCSFLSKRWELAGTLQGRRQFG